LTTPLGRDEMVRLSGAGLMTSVMGPVVVRGVGVLESVPLTVMVVVPAVVGVPVMVQLEMVRPVGKVPAVIEQV
jgi:hypothetical protein